MAGILFDALAGAQAEGAHEPHLVSREQGGRATLPAERNKGPKDTLLVTGVAAASLGYATLRYNVFKNVPWADWPSYTLNKAIAVAALLLIVLSVARFGLRGRSTGTLMVWAGGLALTHSLLSFALLEPAYYPRLFVGTKLTLLAGLSIMLGAALMAVMEVGARRSSRWTRPVLHGALAVTAFAIGLHAALPAVSTWLTPGTWPGGLPPLTLISFISGSAALIIWWFRPVNAQLTNPTH